MGSADDQYARAFKAEHARQRIMLAIDFSFLSPQTPNVIIKSHIKLND
jgi:hypothetical protein